MLRYICFCFGFLVFGCTLIVSCASDNEEDLAPQPQPQPEECLTNNITYNSTISSILRTNCYSCHSTSIASGGVVLDTYAGVKQQVDNGKLIGVITHAAGFQPMPQGGAKMVDCSIERIRKWIEDGAPNN